MRKLLILPLLLAFALFQATILNHFRVFSVKPDLLLASLVITSLSFPFEPVLVISLSTFTGLLKDMFGIGLFGINTVLNPFWGLLLMNLSRKVSIENNFIRATLISLVVALNDIIIRFIFFSLGNTISYGIFFKIIILEALYTAAVSPLIYKVIQPLLLDYKKIPNPARLHK